MFLSHKTAQHTTSAMNTTMRDEIVDTGIIHTTFAYPHAVFKVLMSSKFAVLIVLSTASPESYATEKQIN